MQPAPRKGMQHARNTKDFFIDIGQYNVQCEIVRISSIFSIVGNDDIHMEQNKNGDLS